ncbi:MAG: hypothetical protein OEV49_16240 [candidate division Zixibacteria bacterium]|nr:hypothetical protein [candidate division Zixibacteria bacterium]MDH3937981.1 hypothetical protein [candidate division Zixibacteria bacterium]MDH4033161.1 hypothetical protein [candidate division Zixibacteria bacterium]
MQVNPVGVQSYQQLNRQDKAAGGADESGQSTESTKVTINPTDQAGESRLAVKVPRGSYADNLSGAEMRALDLLFNRFTDATRFGAGYADDADSDVAEAGMGKVIDMKA